MFIDFSETKRQWALLRSGFMRAQIEQANRGAAQKFAGFFVPLFVDLRKREIAFWLIFFAVSISSTTMILRFIGSFIDEQDKYEMTLTDIGRHRAEYESLGYVGSTTISEKKDTVNSVI